MCIDTRVGDQPQRWERADVDGTRDIGGDVEVNACASADEKRRGNVLRKVGKRWWREGCRQDMQ